MQNYSSTQVGNLIDKYIDKGGEVITIEEGCLGYGITVCLGENLKTAIIQEFYLNEWNSSHKVRFYNKIPKIWQNKINQIN